MAAQDKIRQLLALARSTTFAGERANALELARLLFNKHRMTDARLRWELLIALGREGDAGPEPAPACGPTATTATATDWSAMNDYAHWAAWTAAQRAEWAGHAAHEEERWARDWFEEYRRQQEREDMRRRSRSTARRRRRRKRVWVRGYDSLRSFYPIGAYTREIATRPVTFTCVWCQRTVTQQRFPGPRPAYCSPACKEEAQRAQTRERVRRYRERSR